MKMIATSHRMIFMIYLQESGAKAIGKRQRAGRQSV